MYNIIRELNITYELDEDFILFVDGDYECSYNEFVKAIVSVAMHFNSKKVRGKAICIKVSHSIDSIICFMGILLSGNYYVPVSDEAPAKFNQKILEQIDFVHIIDDAKAFVKEVSACNTPDINIFDDLLLNIDHMTENVPMYIIFTSGSTGIPKGIIKSAYSLMEFLNVYAKEFEFDNKMIIGNQTPFYFDASVKDIYLTLYCKSQMVIISSDMFSKPTELAEYMNKMKISIIQWVPSALCMLSVVGTIKDYPLRYLKKVFFVGEMFPIKQLKKWMDTLQDVEYINLYGSSEIAGICSYAKITKNMMDNEKELPIGRPLSNYNIVLVDNDGNIITDNNVYGLLYVSGDAVADGYVTDYEVSNGDVNNIDVTNDDVAIGDFTNIKSNYGFVHNIMGRESDEKLYCSGDIAKYNDSGLLVLKGRADYQIKHMGHRIELQDIENAAEEIDGVEKSICVHDKSKIILYYSGSIEKKMLITALKGKLPLYMIPNKVVKVESVPLNGNGKKDRQYFVRL